MESDQCQSSVIEDLCQSFVRRVCDRSDQSDGAVGMLIHRGCKSCSNVRSASVRSSGAFDHDDHRCDRSEDRRCCHRAKSSDRQSSVDDGVMVNSEGQCVFVSRQYVSCQSRLSMLNDQ